VQTGKIVGGFAFGTKALYDFMNNNPFVVMCDIAFTNNVAVISQNPKVTAINSCIEVDLTGQVCADSIGTRIYSGVGGQIDFMRGAALSDDGLGKPILAMPSTTTKGVSKIVPMLKPGAGVVTTRAHVHYIVTEYGYAFLFGKTLRQRAYELIRIAHPDHREALEKAAFERLKVMPAP
jgi:acyl-CoA hydrolase